MKSSIFAFYLCFLTSTLLLAQPQSQAQLLLCGDTNPDAEQGEVACPFVYDPVCANYPIQCFVPPCPQVRDFPNSCVACSDPIVQSYILGPCPIENITGDEGVGQETEIGENGEAEAEDLVLEEAAVIENGGTVCDVTPGVLVSCDATYEPVCGFNFGQSTGTTYGNGCVACYEGGVDYHLPGECPLVAEENVELVL